MTIVINGTTGISGVDGSAATPAVQGADTNTGVFYPAADTVGVSTGGSERLRVDSSGNVGIGTNSNPGTPVAGRLSVLPASNITTVATSTTLTLGEPTNNSAYQLRMAYSYLSSVYTGVIDAVQNSLGAPLAINPTGGNVGIGTTSITQAFANYTQLNISGSTGATIQMQTGATNRANIVADGNALYIAGLSGAIAFGVNGTGTGTEVGRFGSTGLFQFNSGYGSVATAYGCRAWVNFSATAGSTTIRGSGNISSITYNAVGDFTLNFSTAMPDANYAFTAYTGQAVGDERVIGAIQTQTTSALRFSTMYVSNTGGGGTNINNTNTHCAIFR